MQNDKKKELENQKRMQEARRKIIDEIKKEQMKLQADKEKIINKQQFPMSQISQNSNNFNPYQISSSYQTYSKVSRKDHWQLNLKDRGIHQDYIFHPDYFRNCINCYHQFKPNQQIKIRILPCSHVLCSDCIQKDKTSKCKVYNCQKVFKKQQTKDFDFNKKQQLIPTFKKIKNFFYHIKIQILDDNHKGQIQETVQGYQNLISIVQKHKVLKSFFEKMPKALLTIKDQQIQYDLIKQTSFYQLAQKYELIPLNEKDNRLKTNTIKYYSNQKGGKS